jgi:MscS family membrane protein
MRCVVLCLALLCGTTSAFAKKSTPTCKNPRDTADSVFNWQLGDEQSLSLASRCFERDGRNQKQLERSAQHLKAVFDAEGAFVEMDKISDDPKYLDEDKRGRVVPHSSLSDVVIEKRGERWLWTKESLDRVDHRYADTLQGIDSIVETLPAWLHGKVFDVAYWQYIALILLFAVGLLARKIIAAVVAARIKQLGDKLGQRWMMKLVDMIASPGATLVTVVVLRIGYPQLKLPVDAALTMSVAVRILLTISIIWAVYRGVDVLSARLAERAENTESKLDDQLIPLLSTSLKVVVFVIAVLIVLDNLNVDVKTMLAGLSIGGLAFGLAAKDTLANLFGSVSIFVDSPFQIGDWINVDGVDGTVEEVGFRSTRIRTFYNSVVVIPNARVADAKVDNYGRREMRRCFFKLGLTYDTTPEQMQAFVEGMRAIIQANAFTNKSSYEVHMSAFGDSALEVMVYFFFRCDTWTEELRERHNVYLEALRLARALGVSFAFPTQSLHIEALPKSGARELPAPPDLPELVATVHAFAPGGTEARPDGPELTESGYMPGIMPDRGSEDGG